MRRNDSSRSSIRRIRTLVGGSSSSIGKQNERARLELWAAGSFLSRTLPRCYTNSRNYPIQAAAADLQLLAIQRIHVRLVEGKFPAFFVNFIHDELVLEAREDLVDEVSSLLVEEMTGAFLALFKSYKPEPVVQGLVEVGVGCNYAEAKS